MEKKKLNPITKALIWVVSAVIFVIIGKNLKKDEKNRELP